MGQLDTIQKYKIPADSKDLPQSTLNLRSLYEKVLATIRLALGDGPLLQVYHVPNTSAILERLKALYSTKGFSSEFLLFKEFFKTTLILYDRSIETFINTIRRIYNNLRAKDLQVPEKLVII